MRRGVYPGSFNPPTIAHLAIAEAARMHCALDVVHLAISTVALDKESVVVPLFEQRVAVVRDSVAQLDWLDVVVTDAQLLADIAADYDGLVMGGDKWAQLHELRFYESRDHMDSALNNLPDLAIAPRDGVEIPSTALLDLEPWVAEVSSSQARTGRTEWMTTAAVDSGLWPTA